jgi:hypothetical protein
VNEAYAPIPSMFALNSLHCMVMDNGHQCDMLEILLVSFSYSKHSLSIAFSWVS